MKAFVRKSERSDLLASLPLESPEMPGWFFGCREVSPGHYLAEGKDLYGHAVSRHGDDEDGVLKGCLADASAILHATIVTEP